MNPTPLIEAERASRTFSVRVGAGFLAPRRPLRAVDDVSLAIAPGETVALVGESGSGKSTLGRLLLGLLPPTSGAVSYEGTPLASLRGESWRIYRRAVQAVFQDASASLNPRRSVGDSVAVPLRHNRGLDSAAARREAAALLARVGLPPERFLARFPHELSGGQRQRVGIARAIASQPRVVIADEPVSALDVSVRSQVLDLLRSLQRESGLAYLFITHDLGVVRAIADRVLVMYLGAIVERGPAGPLLANPGHPYTRALLAATPVPDPTRRRIVERPPVRGEIPSPLDPPSGCRFRTRCPLAQGVCATTVPPVVGFEDGVEAACHFAEQVRSAPAGAPA